MSNAPQTLIRTAPDISCDHCAHAIDQALTALDGVAQVRVDVDAKRVEIEHDPSRVDAGRIDAVLEDEGYPPLR